MIDLDQTNIGILTISFLLLVLIILFLYSGVINDLKIVNVIINRDLVLIGKYSQSDYSEVEKFRDDVVMPQLIMIEGKKNFETFQNCEAGLQFDSPFDGDPKTCRQFYGKIVDKNEPLINFLSKEKEQVVVNLPESGFYIQHLFNGLLSIILFGRVQSKLGRYITDNQKKVGIVFCEVYSGEDQCKIIGMVGDKEQIQKEFQDAIPYKR